MKTPILDGLKKLKGENSVSFHMPGHKGKNTLIEWGGYIPYVDTTEVTGMDNLHDPRGIIKESQELAAKAFGAKETIYSINGTTGGIYIALSAVTNPGDKILIQRNSHKSMYNGAILNRLNVEYMYPNYNKKYHVLTGMDPDDIELKLKQDEYIKVVTIVYPNYYGVCSDLKRIAEIVHKYNRILLVDEAHGSHFTFSDKLPMSAIEAGADIVVQSTHKTLPSFTQTSMIHVGTARVDIDKLRDMSSLYQTTSPSYLFMASLEIARAYMEGEGKEKLEESISLVEETIKLLEKIERVHLFTGDEEDHTIYAKDNTKILFRLDGMTGTRAKNILREDYNIRLEMADYYYALILTSLMNEKEDFEKLVDAVESMAKNTPYEEVVPVSIEMPTPKIISPIYEAFYGNKKVMDLRKSIGKISASYVIPYPPGIPLICPGEEITKELCEHIWFLMDKGIEIVGLIGYNKDKIEVVD